MKLLIVDGRKSRLDFLGEYEYSAYPVRSNSDLPKALLSCHTGKSLAKFRIRIENRPVQKIMKDAVVSRLPPENSSNSDYGQSVVSRKRQETRQNIIKALILIGFLVASFALIRFSPLADYLKISKVDYIQQRLAEFHGWAPVAFLLGGAVLILLGAPRSLISILGGMMFGLFYGIVLALAAALLGSIVIFWLTRLLGRPLFKQKVGLHLNVIENHSRDHPFLIVILLRQLPLTCLLVNVLIGLTSISTMLFLLGSIVGLLPETIIFALFGSSVQGSFVWRVSLAGFLLILLGLIVKNHYQRSPLARELAFKFKNRQ